VRYPRARFVSGPGSLSIALIEKGSLSDPTEPLTKIELTLEEAERLFSALEDVSSPG
jgi:hypothetical protein